MSPAAIRDDEMGGGLLPWARAYGAAWTGTGLSGTLAPQTLQDPQHLVQVADRVDVELRGRPWTRRP